jgi:uncharacterized protein (TIGR02231 family)
MFRVLIFLPLVLFSISANAEEFLVDSELKAATVYTNRATLTRQATVQIPKGAHKVVFKGLPANILTDSLRAEGSSGADVIFGALTHKRVIEAELTAPREKELNDQLQMFKDQQSLIFLEEQALKIKKEFLSNIGKHAGARTNEEISNIELNPEEWGAAAQSIYEGVSQIHKEAHEKGIKVREIEKQIAKIKAEIALLRTGSKNTYQVTIPIESSAATNLKVNLSYQIPSASWHPVYDARLDTEDGNLTLTQYGAVRQNTGEDWKDIELTLSTAQPQRGASLPALSPKWVNLWENRTRYNKSRSSMNAVSFGAGGAGAPAAMMAMDAPAEMLEEEAVLRKEVNFAAAKIETGGYVSKYIIPGPSTVNSDGSESKVMIGGFDTENMLQIHIKPQINNSAYLVGKMTLKGDAPILPGQASLFRDGAYVGQAYLSLLRPNEKTTLSFGIDDQVSVERHVMKDESGEDGVLTKDNTQEKRFKTVVKNLHNMKVDIVLFETVPVAKDEKLKIEVLSKATTEGYQNDTDNVKGLFSWGFTLKASEEKEINLGWKVSWPSGLNISGL